MAISVSIGSMGPLDFASDKTYCDRYGKVNTWIYIYIYTIFSSFELMDDGYIYVGYVTTVFELNATLRSISPVWL